MAVIETKEQDERTLLYRRVFNTPDGRRVLSDMVLGLDVFSSIPPEDHERAALRNFGLALLYDVGVLVDSNLEGIIDRMMDMEYTPILQEEKPGKRRAKKE